MTEKKPKGYRIAFTNAAEDVPRLLLAHGKCSCGEHALALRPHDGSGVFIAIPKKSKEALLWRSGSTGDAPRTPTEDATVKEAVSALKDAKKLHGPASPITMRGAWRGVLRCEDGVPIVELSRAISTYSTVTVVSSGNRWKARIERAEKWFSTPSREEIEADTLKDAIQGAYRRSHGVLGAACAVRDSHRRASVDPGYAAEHPVKPAKVAKDPTERVREPKERKPRAPRAVAPPAAAPAEPRKPGRPRKTETPAPAVPPVAATEPKKRGRPRKAEPTLAPPPAPVAAEPKKQGGPRKSDAQGTQTPASEPRPQPTEQKPPRKGRKSNAEKDQQLTMALGNALQDVLKGFAPQGAKEPA